MRRVASKARGDEIERRRAVVAGRLSALEPGLTVLESGLRVGRTTIDLVALDAKQTLVLIAVTAVADEKLLLPTLDAYLWCLQYPDRLQKLYPSAGIADGRPPRVMFIAERVPENFVAWVEELTMVNAECVEVGQLAAGGADLAPVAAHAAAPASAAAVTAAADSDEAEELVIMNDHAMVDDVVAAVLATETQDVAAAGGGRENGHIGSNGTRASNGVNGVHGTNGHHAPTVRHLFARATLPDAAGAPAASGPTAPASPPSRETPAADPKPARSAKSGGSKQWQDFLDELATKA